MEQTRAALEESEERYRQIVEDSPLAIAVHSDQAIVFVNQTAVDLLGLQSAEQLLGKDIWPFIHPEDRASVAERIKRIYANDARLPALEERFIRASGEIIHVEVAGRPVRWHGRPASQVVFRDISERKQAEEALRASEERYRLIMDQAGPGILLAAPDGRYLEVNQAACAMLGYSREELLKMRIPDVTAPQDRDLVEARMEQIQAGPVEQRRVLVRKDGTNLVVELSGRVLSDGNLLAMVRDLTEQLTAERKLSVLNRTLEDRVLARTMELEMVNRELESFAYSVSHDLRAPLRAISGFSTALLEDSGDDLGATARHYLERIEAGCHTMGVLIEALLSLSRTGSSPAAFEDVNLARLAERSFQSVLEDHPGRSDLRLLLNPPDDDPAYTIRADRRLMGVVLDNLLGNAVKFTALTERPRIEFGVDDAGGYRRFFVRDNGAGFEMDLAERLFTPFQRLHDAEQFEGTGIGLATVQRIIHRLGGTVRALGTVGRGATFYFTIGDRESPNTAEVAK